MNLHALTIGAAALGIGAAATTAALTARSDAGAPSRPYYQQASNSTGLAALAGIGFMIGATSAMSKSVPAQVAGVALLAFGAAMLPANLAARAAFHVQEQAS